VPEFPEIEALVRRMRPAVVGRKILNARTMNPAVLKTVDPPLGALTGQEVVDVHRRAKYVAVEAASDLFLVVHLAKAGSLRHGTFGGAAPKPLALAVALDDGTQLRLLEQGHKKRAAVWVVRSMLDVARIEALGPEAVDVTRDELAERLAGAGRRGLRPVLTDQRVIAGIGGAYSDEIAFAAKLAPNARVDRLTDDEVDRLHGVIAPVLRDALAVLEKNPKADPCRIHGHAGELCPVCATPLAGVFYEETTMVYCSVCQTGGKVLADRKTSAFLK